MSFLKEKIQVFVDPDLILPQYLTLIQKYSMKELKNIFQNIFGYEPCKSFLKDDETESRKKIVLTELIQQLCYSGKTQNEIESLLIQLNQQKL